MATSACANVTEPEASSDHDAQPISLVECAVIIVLGEMQARPMSPAVFLHRLCMVFYALLAHKQELS